MYIIYFVYAFVPVYFSIPCLKAQKFLSASSSVNHAFSVVCFLNSALSCIINCLSGNLDILLNGVYSYATNVTLMRQMLIDCVVNRRR